MTFTDNSRLAVKAENAIEKYRFAKVGAGHRTVDVATAGTDNILGVTVDECGATAENAVTVQTTGTIKVTASAAIAVGDYLTATADGKAVATTTAGDTVRAIALASATAVDQVIEAQLVYFPHA